MKFKKLFEGDEEPVTIFRGKTHRALTALGYKRDDDNSGDGFDVYNKMGAHHGLEGLESIGWKRTGGDYLQNTYEKGPHVLTHRRFETEEGDDDDPNDLHEVGVEYVR